MCIRDRRTAQQQTPLEILRVCNDPAVVRGHQRQRTVFALPKLTIPDDKVLLLEIVEKNGADVYKRQLLHAHGRYAAPRAGRRFQTNLKTTRQ